MENEKKQVKYGDYILMSCDEEDKNCMPHNFIKDMSVTFMEYFEYMLNDGFNDINVGLCEVESGLAGLSCNAGGENYDIGVACVAVCSGIDGYRRAERCSLANVKCFSESLFFIDVDHYDLGCYTAYSERISNCRADASCANNGNFCHKSSSKLKFL